MLTVEIENVGAVERSVLCSPCSCLIVTLEFGVPKFKMQSPIEATRF